MLERSGKGSGMLGNREIGKGSGMLGNRDVGRGSGMLGGRDFGKGFFFPQPISRVEDTGLSGLWLQDLALKILYFQGYLTGYKIADEMALPV